MDNLKLSVLLPTRDRPLATQKVIESIYENTTLFDEIDIYIFDNLSSLENNRMDIFQNLLKEGKIKYYSYDTSTSLSNCFGKGVAFKRWIGMMRDTHDVLAKRNPQKLESETRYYLLIDSDMLVGPKWDQFFISAIRQIPKNELLVHYIVQLPGGVPSGARKRARKYNITNQFSGEQFTLWLASFGGGSGFWFMNYNMLSMLEWTHHDLAKTYNSFKKHDSTTWIKIREKIGSDDYLKYVCAIELPRGHDPLVLHLGSKIGSICNSETDSTRSYAKEGSSFLRKELNFMNLSVKELFEQNKHSCKEW